MEERIKFELVNKALWDSFDYYGNEMIITKVGRRIFPSIDIKISNLNPNKYYGLFLDFTRVTSNRFKYSPKFGWTVGRSSDINHVMTFYQHPESPALGSHWMSKTAVFDKVLFSNNVEVTPNIIILSSMHKYLPRIHIYEINNSETELCHYIMSFPETSFVAVTAYQNSQITELKVQNNKYANGHRMKHDQDKIKRKENVDNESENLTKKHHEDDTEEDTSSEDCEKFYESRECSLYCPFYNKQSSHVYPLRPEPLKPNFIPFDLLPYKLDNKKLNNSIKHNQDKIKRKEHVDNESENLTKNHHEDDTEEDRSSQDCEKFCESRECSLYCPFYNKHSSHLYPLRPEPLKPNFIPFDLLPYHLDYKKFNNSEYDVKNVIKNEKHTDDVKSYTDFTIRTLLNIA